MQILLTPTDIIEEYPVWSILTDHLEVVQGAKDPKVSMMAVRQCNGAKYKPRPQNDDGEHDNDCFEEMITSINAGMFRPDQDICGMYLHSEPKANWTKTKGSWFRTGQIDMTEMSVIQGHLPEAQKQDKPL